MAAKGKGKPASGGEQNERGKSQETKASWEMAIGREIDWQGGRNLPDSNLYMLANQLNCDVTFRVGETGEPIPAHKYMLTSRSYVFQKMFFESETIMEENDEIEVEDIDPSTFRHMLVYLYTDDVRLNPENAPLLLFAANKYKIKSLRSRTIQYLEADLSPDSACVIMEQAHVYEEEGLRQKALQFILKYADGTLRAETVGELCNECLCLVLGSDDMNAPEDVAFLAALYWSECELQRQEEDITPEARRQVLGDAVYKIRYPQMDKKFFVQSVCPYGVLNDVEANTVLQYYVYPQVGAAPFITQPRKGTFLRPEMYEPAPKIEKPPPTSESLPPPVTQIDLPPMAVEQTPTPQKGKGSADSRAKKKRRNPRSPDTNLLRFSTRDDYLSWRADGSRDDAVSFGCDQDFVLVGFLLFGPSKFERCNYLIKARVIDDKERVVQGGAMQLMVEVNPRDKFYAVPFKNALDLEKFQIYTLIVNISGEPTYQGGNGNNTVHIDDMTFKFFDSALSQNGTTVSAGQIPGLVINKQ